MKLSTTSFWVSSLALGLTATAAASPAKLASLRDRASTLPAGQSLQTPFNLSMPGDGRTVTGALRVERIASQQCRHSLMLSWPEPYEKNGVAFSGYRRLVSVEGPCQNLPGEVQATARHQLALLSHAVGVTRHSHTLPPLQMARPARPAGQPLLARLVAPRTLPLSRLRVARFKPQQCARLLQARLRPLLPGPAIAAAAKRPLATARNLSLYWVTTTGTTALRAAPRRSAEKRSTLAQGQRHKARLAEGHLDWYELVDGSGFVHESSVAQGPVSSDEPLIVARR